MELIERGKIIIFSTVVCMISAAIASLFLPNIYEAESLILFCPAYMSTQIRPADFILNIEKGDSDFAHSPGVVSNIGNEGFTVHSYLELAKSQDILQQVVDKLKLDKKKVAVRELSKDILKAEIVEQVRTYYTISFVPLLRLKAKMKNKKLVSDIVNTWAEIVRDRSEKIANQKFNESFNYIDGKLSSSEQGLREAETKLREFQKISNIPALKIEKSRKEALLNNVEIEKDSALLEKTKKESEEIYRTICEKEFEFQKLDRERKTAQMAYDLVAEKFEHLKLVKIEQNTAVEIIARAPMPQKPVSPKRVPIILAIGCIAFLSSAGISFIIDHLKNIQ